MININYTHSSGSSSNSKTFIFTGSNDMVITERVTPQAKQIIELAYHLSLENPDGFSLAQLIHYIDECCAYNNTTFTTSKGGTERIVRYYSKLLQNIGILTDLSTIDSE